MALAAEKTMQTTVYNGEQKRWDFEKFVNLHKQQHSILDGLVMHGYASIDERSKVRHLVEGIKTNILDTIKGQILASAELRSSFNRSVTLFQDFICRQTKTKSYSTLTIAEVSQADNKQKASNGGSGVVEDRYYTKEEYNALNPEQKKALLLKRKTWSYLIYFNFWFTSIHLLCRIIVFLTRTVHCNFEHLLD
jgi:hypothetical protein